MTDRDGLAFVLSGADHDAWNSRDVQRVDRFSWLDAADRLLAGIASGAVELDGPKRKVQQVMEWHNNGPEGDGTLMRLCDDGTLWTYEWSRKGNGLFWRLCDWPEELP